MDHGEKTECKVCGECLCENNNGEMTCENCRSFFTRSLRKNAYYSCRFNTGLCSTKRQSERNICQYCRMKRCLAVGMKEEASQDIKVGDRYRRPQSFYVLQEECTERRSPKEHYYDNEKIKRFKSYPSLPYIRPAHDIRREAIGTKSPEHFIETASRWLFMSIKWAKSLPYFAELYYPDQLELLRQNWSKLFLFNLMYFEIVPFMGEERTRKVYKELFLRWSHSNMRPDIPAKFDHSLEKIRRLKMDDTETLLIKSLLLFNPDTEGLVDASQIQVTQNKCHRALEEHATSSKPSERDRSGRILLLILTLTTFEERDIESIFLSTVLGNATVTSLMENILCADAM